MDRKVWLAMGMACTANIIFGFSFLFSKLAMEVASPIVLLSARFTIAFLILTLLWVTGICKMNFKGKDLKPLLVMAIFQPVLYFICESYGIRNTSSSFAGVMMALNPIASMIFSTVILREIPGKKQVAFSLLSIGGVILLTLVGGDSDSNFRWSGFFFLIGAVLSGSLYGIQSRKIAEKFTAFERTYMMFAVGMIVYNGLGLMSMQGNWDVYLVPFSSGKFWMGVLYLGAMSSVGAFMLLNACLNHLDVTRMTVFANVTSVVSLFAGIFIMKESFAPIQFLGVVTCLVGVYGVNKFTAEATILSDDQNK